LIRILKILSENARENIVNIAEKLKTIVDTVRYRIKKLMDNLKNISSSFFIFLFSFLFHNVVFSDINLFK